MRAVLAVAAVALLAAACGGPVDTRCATVTVAGDRWTATGWDAADGFAALVCPVGGRMTRMEEDGTVTEVDK